MPLDRRAIIFMHVCQMRYSNLSTLYVLNLDPTSLIRFHHSHRDDYLRTIVIGN